jgi:arginine N-succinyltransferase
VTSDTFEIRAGTRQDAGELLSLARYLDSVNLPDDRASIERLLDTSERSFARAIHDPHKREYVFVLWDRSTGRAAGTSTVIGQLGRRDAPYIYFDVRAEEKYSATLDRHFTHAILHTTYSYDGPTEVGGLVVHPHYRRRPERLGVLISYVRFLFIAMRRRDMRDDVVAELLPPLGSGGASALWEAVGRRFTGLDYRTADRLSKRNKEFISGLFPAEIPATLLSPEAQGVIGAVGEPSQGVAKMLERIGFAYARRVDPFDGGPHFRAETDAITLVRASRPRRVVPAIAAGAPDSVPALAAVDLAVPPYFVAVPSLAVGDDLHLGPAARASLGASDGDSAWSVPVSS